MSGGGHGDWRAAARAAADLPPAAPRSILWLDRHPVGSIESALAARLVVAGLPLAAADDGIGWRISGPADASLAAIARWLHEQGLSAPWRDERLAVTAADGGPLAAVERAVVRVLGITTWAVHLVGFAPDGRVWIQQRAFDKAVDPGRWDTLMGGQVSAGESIEQTLERETHEEAGLAIAELVDIRRTDRITVRRPVAEGYVVEHIEVFEATVPAALAPRNLDGEVERFECLPVAEVHDWLGAGAFTLEATLILDRALARRGL
jgi:8-oxo-dGTP pyrophosphatase MutT (NUDIX family)